MSIGEVVLPKEDARFCSGKLYDHVDALQAMTAERDALRAAAQAGLDAFNAMIGRKPEFVEQAITQLQAAMKGTS